MDSTLNRPRLRPPSTDFLGRGATLALLAHVVLILGLALGVSWRSREPEGIEADLVAAVPRAAAPKVEAPVPTPTPAPPPPPPAPPKAEPAPPPPGPSEAEIALEKARKEKLLREQQERERLEREADLKRKQAEDAKKREQEELKRRQAEAQKREEAERQRKEAAEQKRKAAEQEAKLAKLREENLKRMQGMAGTGPATSTGTAARSAGPSAGYAGRVIARIKPNIVYGGDRLSSNPAAVVEVRAAADGTIVGRRLVQSSGIKEWDEAVLRAIDRTDALPRDTDGSVPSPLHIYFKPND